MFICRLLLLSVPLHMSYEIQIISHKFSIPFVIKGINHIIMRRMSTATLNCHHAQNIITRSPVFNYLHSIHYLTHTFRYDPSDTIQTYVCQSIKAHMQLHNKFKKKKFLALPESNKCKPYI